ncbi:hypothetical protein [Photorhabdus sp. CRCIA-P01]|uniref:hypothetical protein n=1 Tax=Photorhabdus sp. CRCIA-P01 TaxID=2019570 RepID=UPI001300893D|nr:hypothetical protein [Photorhabdus sp. CRCIA-P01]
METAPTPEYQWDVWRRETSQRLGVLFETLRRDGWFAYSESSDVPHIARLVGEDTPAFLMDCMDGRSDLTFDLANRIAYHFDARTSWLLSGDRTPFPVQRIGSQYQDFSVWQTAGRNTDLSLSGLKAGIVTAICFAFVSALTRTAGHLGMSAQFKLGDGIGVTGRDNLRRFIQFLKTECADLQLDSYIWEETPEQNTYDAASHHHPVYFRDFSRRDTNRWLFQLMSGRAIG